ncbi:serine--tRNA ligase [Nitratifractor salsuginis]|uniref:Serine--tRNA ligase n=1 Tax=Nitratifractor salsuginis (strain DSM 16511 / JCM 12458 / E9I37-1) TaxID=749222 RepID=E6WZY7_NITSE|nr:serine--tRNA ligase [Nitratifractor salsuginis]ADV45645.1 seryl-tRNA synthetase [Nitratifractor salsuginis DSM 16511]
MIDLKYLQNNFEEASALLRKKGVGEEALNRLKERFEKLKEFQRAFEESKAEQNRLSRLFGQYKREGKDVGELQERVASLKSQVNELQEQAREAEKALVALAMGIPNFPDESVPEGLDEEDNVEIKRVLEPRAFDFQPKEHWELAEQNGWIDFERGVKLAKSRFALLRGQGARLQTALINFFLDRNIAAGFEEYAVPFMVNSEMLRGTGQLPKFEEDLFKVCDEDLYLIPTAEVPLTNIYHDEILPAEELPVLMTAYSPCFRKEAGSAGRDTRGMIRQHQFAKVEMVAITRPEESDEIFQKMVQQASDLLTELGLPHRWVELCTGDLGFSAARTVDLEVWLPGQGKYREISSISNTRDFQARRAKIRFKDGKKNWLVHTLNGSALAVGRTLVAIMENYQQADGSIEIPEALKPYL